MTEKPEWLGGIGPKSRPFRRQVPNQTGFAENPSPRPRTSRACVPLHRLAGWSATNPTLLLRIQENQYLLDADRSPAAAGDESPRAERASGNSGDQKKQPRRDDGHQPRTKVNKTQIRIAESHQARLGPQYDKGKCQHGLQNGAIGQRHPDRRRSRRRTWRRQRLRLAAPIRHCQGNRPCPAHGPGRPMRTPAPIRPHSGRSAVCREAVSKTRSGAVAAGFRFPSSTRVAVLVCFSRSR